MPAVFLLVLAVSLPLHDAALGLDAARDAAAAAAVLERLEALDAGLFGVPADAPGGPSTGERLGRLLLALDEVSRRLPAVRTRVDRLVTSWSFCEANRDNRPWDLARSGGGLVRRPAAISDDAWRGFAVWGFTPDDPLDRHRIELPVEPGPSALSVIERAGRLLALVRARCLPHPANGVTPFDALAFAGPPSGPNPGAAPKPVPAPPVKIDQAEKVDKAEGRLEEAKKTIPAAPLPSAAPPSTGAAPPALPAVPPAADHAVRLAGSVHGVYRLEGSFAFGLGARLAHESDLFVRLGAESRIGAAGGPRWSWGVGLESWRPGTFSVQVNQWGPLEFDAGLGLRDVVVDVGYRLPQLQRGALRLNGYVSLDGSPRGSAGLNLNANATFRDVWFVLVGFSPRLAPDVDWRVVYSFGRADWAPFAPTVTYSNWGPNPPDDWNFVQNGAISVGVNWAL